MTIDAASTALLVIDILVTESPDAVYATNPEEEALVANAAQLTRAARGAGMPVLFLCDQHIPGIDRELSLWGEHGMRGEAHPHPALEAGSGSRDFVIPKRRYSGFFQTELGLTCNELGVNTLVVVGCDTNICVAHTLADAFYRNFATVVVEDATITFLGVGTQEGAIADFPKLYGSKIVSVDELAGMLA